MFVVGCAFLCFCCSCLNFLSASWVTCERARQGKDLGGIWLIFSGQTIRMNLQGGTYKGFTIGSFAKFLNSFLQDSIKGLGNYSLPGDLVDVSFLRGNLKDLFER